ncbi:MULTISPECIES: hypothetical protein [Stenotrophomonas]|uniref:hypothetical protein n=1 Tax=Stenotrophomonas TaxID=40323 RepID=UPI000A300A85|nr:hypothetical protein [Stenotrophomonas maltophilia]ARQ88541.1 hypothetical protein A7326_02560 [Stenotrophomonas maltophilia]
MYPYLMTVLSVAACSFLLLVSGSLFVRMNDGVLVAAGRQGAVVATASLVLGVVAMMLLVINFNLWFPGNWIYYGLVPVGAYGLLRLVRLRRTGGTDLLLWTLVLAAAVAVIALGVGIRLDAANYWLVETSNHDTLFYFEGSRWAPQHPIYVSPDLVADTLNLGGCRSGAVYIGNDCPVYRGGSYSVLGMALAYGGGGTANEMIIASALGALFIGLGLLPVAALSRSGSSVARFLWLPVLAALIVVIYFSPSMLAAAINSNVATTIGASAAAMLLAIAASADRCWWRRALVLGLGASLAAHCYGEAAAAAVIFAAFGVASGAVYNRSWAEFIKGGLLCAAAFFLASNVLVLELLQSASDVEGIASGGTWEGRYLHANPLTWLASPFAGMVVNGNPYVSHRMLNIGWLLTLLVGLGCARILSTRVAMISFLLVSSLLIGFVEIRDYAYGEHKVVQMIGPAACVLAAVLILNCLRIFGETDRNTRVRGGALVYAGVVFLLLLLAIVNHVRPSMHVVEGWKGMHGLSLDFERDLPKGAAQEWVLDDAGTEGVERFQKSHYVSYLAHERKSHAYLPNLDAEGMRGGYARIPLGDTLKNAKLPRWVVQLKSFTGVKSPFEYPKGSMKESTEYNVIDLAKSGSVVAVSGAGWLPCRVEGCPVTSGFEIEAIVSAPPTERCHLTVYADHAPEYPSVETSIHSGDTLLKVGSLLPNGMKIPLVAGWQRIRLDDPQGTPGALWMVHKISSTCHTEDAGP